MKLLRLEEILEKRIIRIPDYQRGYSWDDKNIEDLWNDIQNITNDSIHFMGSITLQNVLYDNEARFLNEFTNSNSTLQLNTSTIEFHDMKYDVSFIVDGQQRITSIIILIKVICDKLEELGNIELSKTLASQFILTITNETNSIYKFGYIANIPCYTWFKGNILGDTKYKDAEKSTYYTNALSNSKNFFRNRLANYTLNGLTELLKKVKNLRFSIFDLPTELNVSLVFETMNNRGKILSNLEKLKNRLIYIVNSNLITHSQVNLQDFIVQKWAQVYENLGKNDDKILDDDEFLKAHWLCYFNHDSRVRKDFKEFRKHLFDEIFIKSNNLTASEIYRYASSLEELSFYWEYLQNNSFPDDYAVELKFWNQKLKRLPHNYGEYLQPLLLSALYRWYNISDVSKVETVFKLAERHNFIIYLISHHKTNQNREFFFRRTHHLYKNLTSKQIADDLIEKTEINYNLNDFQIEIWHGDYENNYRNWVGLKYFLYEYEISINSTIQIEYKDLTTDIIYNSQYDWGNQFKNKKNESTISRNSKSKLMNSLGNMTIRKDFKGLESIRNMKVYNDFASRCNQIIRQTNVGLASGLENEKLVCAEDFWAPSKIYDRGVLLLEFMSNRWEFNMPQQLQNKLLFPNANIDDYH